MRAVSGGLCLWASVSISGQWAAAIEGAEVGEERGEVSSGEGTLHGQEEGTSGTREKPAGLGSRNRRGLDGLGV